MQFIRQFVALPPEVQRTLRSFFAMAKDNPASVKVSASRIGEITLASPDVTEVVRMIAPDQQSKDSLH
jgi:hypothetical protein